MQVFLYTSGLVAASEGSHPHHAQALPALRRVAKGEDQGFIGVHSLSETHAALTRLPVQPRMDPSEACRIIGENILEHFTLVPGGKAVYLRRAGLHLQRGPPGCAAGLSG